MPLGGYRGVPNQILGDVPPFLAVLYANDHTHTRSCTHRNTSSLYFNRHELHPTSQKLIHEQLSQPTTTEQTSARMVFVTQHLMRVLGCSVAMETARYSTATE